MVKVKRIIFNYFEFFKKRLTSKQMKYIDSLLILGLLVFVYSKVSPRHFLHVFKKKVAYVASPPPKSASVDM